MEHPARNYKYNFYYLVNHPVFLKSKFYIPLLPCFSATFY